MDDEAVETDELIAAVREKVFAAAVDSIDWYTAPICLYHDGKLIPDRSGVLLQIGSLHFVVTAAHLNNDHQLKDAMDHGYDPCITMPAKGLLPVVLGGTKYLSTKSKSEDITVILLTDEIVAQLRDHYRFLRLTDVAPLDTLRPTRLYLINGFPLNLVRQEPNAKRSEVWRYVTCRYQGNIDDVENFDPDIHLALHYDKHSYSGDGIRVSPKGMSGCGVWYVAEGHVAPHVSPESLKLVGIQTAWHPRLQYALATRIRLVLYIIWRYYPDSRDVMKLHGLRF
ncbi:MAG: hypothetical protein DCC68_18445 [Planctomycetota bacterium]|nr:MAG: hypothetical protein DCC68_18445 [Planctomycetota bacterium]